jgi:hypothetical protein
MPNFFNISELLGDPNQDTTLTLRAKPLPAPEAVDVSNAPLKSKKVDTTQRIEPIQSAQASQELQGEEQPGFLSSLLASPTTTTLLSNVATSLDPTGVGGMLCRAAQNQLESQQFGRVIAKIERGEALTAEDVIGLSPQAQQQAFNVVQARGASGRAERELALREEAAPGEQALTAARTEQIVGAGEQALSEIEARNQAAQELERLKQAGDANWRLDRQIFADRVDYGIINQRTGERKSIAVGDPSPRDLGIFDQGGRRGETGKKITGSDLDFIGRQVVESAAFSKFLNAQQKFLGIPTGAITSDTPERKNVLLRQLAAGGLTLEKYKEVTGQKDITPEEIEDVERINRLANQMELFNRQAEFQPQLGVQAAQPQATETPQQVDTGARFMTNTIQSMTPAQQDEFVGSIPPETLQLIDAFLTNNGKALNSKNRAIIFVKNFGRR